MDKTNEITQKEIALIESDLKSKQSEKRRKAAKKIGKLLITELGPALYAAYLLEKEDKRTWETQSFMITALGRIGYRKLLPHVTQIIKENIELDAITNHAATAYVRLKRKKVEDVSPIYELFKTGKHSVLGGAVDVLAYDQVIPKEEDMHKLIKLVNDSIHLRNPGVMDTREVLANAMSRWPKEIITKHLADYKKIKSISKDTIGYALKGKSYYKEY